MKSQTMIQKALIILFAILWLIVPITEEAEANTALSRTLGSIIPGNNKGTTLLTNQPGIDNIGVQRPQSNKMFMSNTFASDICNHTIGLSVGKADARSNYSAVQPGDTVCIESGERGSLTLKNFEGTAENPITFINHGGQVVISTKNTNAISIRNSRYFRFTGSGVADLPYGIKIVEGRFQVAYQSSDFEIDHVEGRDLYAKTSAVCSDGSTTDWRAYDYDGDGITGNDIDDVFNRETFTQYNTIIHDNYFHNSGFEGFYIGEPGHDSGYTLNCASGTEPVFPPELKGVDIYNNSVENAGWEGIQVKSAIADCNIHHNRVLNYNTKGHKFNYGGIALAPGSVCNIYNNFIKEGKGSGIDLKGYGGNKVYNNVIVAAGKGRTYNRNGAGIAIKNTGNSANNVYVWHNTIIDPQMIGIDYQNNRGNDNRIQNNLIVNPGNGIYIDGHEETNVTISNNFEVTNIAAVKFTNPAADDYSLQPGSPAIDTGTNLSSQGITADYTGGPRPQGLNFDAGAFESESSDPNPIPTDEPTPTSGQVSLAFDGSTSVNTGETFDVDVVAQNVSAPGLYGVQLEINYDPALISASNLQINPNLSFVVLKTVDNTVGKISLVASEQGKTSGLTGNVTLLSFQATATDTSGTATFRFENEKFSDTQIQSVDIVSEGYSLEIAEVTSPVPTEEPAPVPTEEPAPVPTEEPAPVPTEEPAPVPTEEPVPAPTEEPAPVPTEEPTMADVSGQVNLAGRANNDWSGVTLAFEGSDQVGITGTSGFFNVTNVSASLITSIMANASGYLSAKCTDVNLTAPQTDLSPVVLLSGDVNDDELVDIIDATTAGASFGQTGSNLPADITRDEVVDIFDIVSVSLNFGEAGPQAWNCLGQ
ncbi:MAG: hypothetical protein GY796_11910 [Chloroflexi bacterium]|nr:hypothetical protein [Chloroflexota bacterium]